MAKPPKVKSTAKLAKKPGDRRGAPKGKFKNPPFQPTKEQREHVVKASAIGRPHDVIGTELSISKDTLERHFRAELDDGLVIANSEIGGVLFEKAKSGDVRAIEQWFDRRGGPDWKKKTALEHTGANGGPIEYRDLKDEEIDARLDALLNRDDAAHATKH